MQAWRPWASTLLVCGLLAACGGGDSEGTDRHSRGPRLVSFGDSLSDVGTYQVSGVAAVGGGKYTINGPDGQIWIELLATELDLASPCAAQTGLEANEAIIGFPPVSVVDHEGCFAYAQGGARVTNPIGPYNKYLLDVLGDPRGALGQLTDPLLNQIGRYLQVSKGRFGPDDLVTVLAGGNDVLMVLPTVGTPGGPTPEGAVAALAQAGAEMAGYVQTQMIDKGARRIVLVLLPDLSVSPFGQSQTPEAQGLINAMVQAYNGQLLATLGTPEQVLVVDAYTASRAQVASPAEYGLTNVTAPACNHPLGSLGCTEATLFVTPAAAEGFLFADGVHPTPTGHRQIFELVKAQMQDKGWL